MIVDFSRSKKNGVIIARNRKYKLPDVEIEISYYPKMDPYFVSAFSGRFGKDLENGKLVIHTKKEGTNQEVVNIYWNIYRRNKMNGKQVVFDYLDNHKDNLDELENAINTIAAVGIWDTFGYFTGLVGDYIISYMNTTAYNKGLTTLVRMRNFIDNDPIMAEYIWNTNFNTEKKRFAFAADMEIGKRDQNKFIKANGISELRSYIATKEENMRKKNSSIYDDMPQHLWDKIKKAEKELKSAKDGVRVGRCGRYISSDQIDSAQNMLKNAWVDADKWVGKNRAKK
jgi:hypothetical protein